MDIRVKYFDDTMTPLEHVEKGDWVDLRVRAVKINGEFVEGVKVASQDYGVEYIFPYQAGDFLQIYTGVAMQLPQGHEAHVAPRSSTFKNWGFIQTNSVGIIDETYCGDNDEWFIPYYALKDGEISKDDRVAQFRVMDKMPKIHFKRVVKLGNEDRLGFGSSGVK